MKKLTSMLCLMVFLLIGATSCDNNGSLEAGKAAYERGNCKTALRELMPLAEQGDGEAMLHIGLVVEAGFIKGCKGKRFEQNFIEAQDWYRKSAEAGNAAGQMGYAYALSAPEFCRDKCDNRKSVAWYRKSAEQGHAHAQHNLCLHYKTGEGVAKDYVYAYMWCNLSNENGRAAGGRDREKIAAKMTPSQIAEAQKLTRECILKKYKDC